MTAKPEYLRFVDSEMAKPIKTRVVRVISTRSGKELGRIHWYNHWRQYVFSPNALTVWNTTCLDQVACEVGKMNREHREMLQRERASNV